MITADLGGKRALVTGAASGIGLAAAELLARCGARVALNDLADNPALQRETDRLRGDGLGVVTAPGNCGDADDAARMVRVAAESLGGLDYLINNAGTPGAKGRVEPHDFKTQSAEFWSTLLSVNLLGPYHCTVAARPYLMDSGGAIVNTASIAGIRGNGSSSPYSATKAALISLTREHARAFGPEVRVNAIAPGMVRTNWDARQERPPEFWETVPLQREGEPEDFAEVILFLCAGAHYVTGETVVVDGGATCGPRSAP